MKMLLNHENSDKTSSHVGFDGGILYYNTKDKIIKYSGAQILLFIVQEGKCTIPKGDKHSMGYLKSDANYPFTEYSYNVSQGVNIYLSSDGYLDQTGGRKMFYVWTSWISKSFGDALAKAIRDSKKYFNRYFLPYKQSQEHKDDLTIVGLKIL